MPTPSQNVTFCGESVGDDEFEPPGHAIATRLRERLQRDGFDAAEEDNWRDCGWSIEVTCQGFTIEIAITRTAVSGPWVAQVAALNEPGFILRMLGRPFVSRDAEVLAVARSFHKWLLDAGYTDVLWSLNEFPEPGKASQEPVASGVTAAS
jgi:hypothetical protein